MHLVGCFIRSSCGLFRQAFLSYDLKLFRIIDSSFTGQKLTMVEQYLLNLVYLILNYVSSQITVEVFALL